MHHDLYDHLKIIIGAIKFNNSSEHYCIYLNTLTHPIVITFMTFDTLSLTISLLKKYDLTEKLCCQVLMKNNQNIFKIIFFS